jgi:hypothetical protein
MASVTFHPPVADPTAASRRYEFNLSGMFNPAVPFYVLLGLPVF